MRSPRTRRLIATGITMLAWGAIVFAWIWLNFNRIDFFQDARPYWRFDFDELYARGTVGGRDAYLYSPAFAQLFWPFGILPWEVFKGLWSASALLVLAWLCGPRIAAVLLLIPGSPISDEISTGNIHLLLAAAVVVGFRYPASWAFVLLTKVTPGIGLLWFLGRREWRSFLVALGATAAISVVSFAIGPGLWFDWFDSLRANTSVAIPDFMLALQGPILLRVAVGGFLALAAGWVGWRWVVPIACFIALPVPWFSAPSLFIAGIVALLRGLPGRPSEQPPPLPTSSSP